MLFKNPSDAATNSGSLNNGSAPAIDQANGKGKTTPLITAATVHSKVE
jgi:hypothetical protein